MGDPRLYALFVVFAGLVGLILGSFTTVCIVRWPQDRSVVFPGSHCEACGAPIRPYDNIPVFSWLILRGRCRDCGVSIPGWFPMLEGLGALLSWMLVIRIVPDPQALDAAHIAAWAFYLVFVLALVVVTFVDWRHRIIPFEVSSYAVPVAILGVVGLDALGYEGWPDTTWRSSVLGATLPPLLLWLTARTMSFILRAEALGFGDVRLMAMVFAVLGFWPASLPVTLAMSIVGSIVAISHALWSGRRTYTPLGPSLCFAALLWVFYGDVLVEAFFPGIGPTPPAWLEGPRHLPPVR